MKTIQETMQNLINHSTQAKFYQGNRDIFLRYFDSLEQYEALIAAWNFKKMGEVIKANLEEGSGLKKVENFINNQSK